MPRRPRIFLPDHPQHVVARGHNREQICIRKTDFQFFIALLDSALARYEIALHAWVLMTNHVHMLVTPCSATGLSRAMQWLGANYSHYFNQNHWRQGPLWERRYKSRLVDTDRYFLLCHRYIEMNPVRAGMVATPGAYPWSSYRQNAGLNQGQGVRAEAPTPGMGGAEDRGRSQTRERSQSLSSDPCNSTSPRLTPHELYLALGRTEQRRHRAYRALFDEVLDPGTLEEFRRGLQSKRRCQS